LSRKGDGGGKSSSPLPFEVSLLIKTSSLFCSRFPVASERLFKSN
jgi:hypothetical protein